MRITFKELKQNNFKMKTNILFIIISLLFINCLDIGDYDPDKLNYGNGFLHPIEYPITINDRYNFSNGLLEDAIQWWENSLYAYWFEHCKSGNSEYPGVFFKKVNFGARVTFVEKNLSDEYGGLAYPLDNSSGEIYKARVEINSNYINEFEIYKHEIGHAVFGLADDSRDFKESVMTIVVSENTKLFDYDAWLIFNDRGIVCR